MKKEKLTLDNCPEFLNGEQVAEIFNISRRTVFNLTASCQLESFKIGRSRRYTKRSLYKFVYEQTGDENYNIRDTDGTYDFLRQVSSNHDEAYM